MQHCLALQAPLASSQTSLGTGEPTHVAEGEPPEWVEQVIVAVIVAKEDVKVVGSMEEGGEGGMGVTVEMTGERVALARH